MSSLTVLRNMRAAGSENYMHIFPCGCVLIIKSRTAQMKYGNTS